MREPYAQRPRAWRLVSWMACIAALTTAACTSTPQIITEPPRGQTFRDTPAPEDAGARTILSVTLSADESPLPPGVASLRFRVADVWLHPMDAAWIRLPADINLFEIADGSRPAKMVLSTSVTSGRYDSLGLSFGDSFVLFDANAGGPLTLAKEEPVRMGAIVHALPGVDQDVELTFSPAASLYQGNDCRWYWLPFITRTPEP